MSFLSKYAALFGKLSAKLGTFLASDKEFFKVGKYRYPVNEFLAYSPSKRRQVFLDAGASPDQLEACEEAVKAFAKERGVNLEQED